MFLIHIYSSPQPIAEELLFIYLPLNEDIALYFRPNDAYGIDAYALEAE